MHSGGVHSTITSPFTHPHRQNRVPGVQALEDHHPIFRAADTMSVCGRVHTRSVGLPCSYNIICALWDTGVAPDAAGEVGKGSPCDDHENDAKEMCPSRTGASGADMHTVRICTW